MSAKPALKSQLARGNAFRASCQVSKNLEMFKKLEAQFRSTRGSEAERTSTVPFKTKKGHWTEEVYGGLLGTRW